MLADATNVIIASKMDSMAIVTLCWLADGLYFNIVYWFVKVNMKRHFCLVLAQLGLDWM